MYNLHPPQEVQVWQMLSKSCADHPSLLQERFTTLTATELREKLLREKVKALRKSSSTQKEIDADEV